MCSGRRGRGSGREDGDLTSDLLGHGTCLLKPSFSVPADALLFGFDYWFCLSQGEEERSQGHGACGLHISGICYAY